MKRRLYWVTALLCPVLMSVVAPNCRGEASSPTRFAASTSTGSDRGTHATPATAVRGVTAPSSTGFRHSLRYLSYSGEQFDEEAAACGAAQPAQPTVSTAPCTTPAITPVQLPSAGDVRRPTGGVGASLRDVGDNFCRGIGNLGLTINGQLQRLQAFGRWCRETAGMLADINHLFAEAYQRLQGASSRLSAETVPVVPAPPTPAHDARAMSVSVSDGYRYIWQNAQGDCILSQDPNFDPNAGAGHAWQRIQRTTP